MPENLYLNHHDAYLAIRTIIELTQTYDLLDDLMNRHFGLFGLSQPKFNALMQLRQAGDQGLVLSELGERMLVSRANITGLIDRLERDHLVTREADPRDGRVIRAKVTLKAQNLLDQILPLHGDFTKQAMSCFTPAEKKHLMALLHKLKTHLDQKKF